MDEEEEDGDREGERTARDTLRVGDAMLLLLRRDGGSNGSTGALDDDARRGVYQWVDSERVSGAPVDDQGENESVERE